MSIARTGASPLVLPRSRTHAALPEASSGGDAVRPHPVTRNENRRTRSTWRSCAADSVRIPKRFRRPSWAVLARAGVIAKVARPGSARYV